MGVEVDVALPGQIEPDVLAVAVTDADDGAGLSEPSRLLGELKAHRIAAAGVGRREDVDADALRTAAAAVARQMAAVGGVVAWILDPELPLPLPEQARAVVEGVVLGGYDPAQWKSTREGRKEIRKVVVCADADDGVRDAAERAARVAEWANRARDLSNAPPNELTPEGLAARASELAPDGVRVDALDRKQILDLGMGAFAGV